jgi:hypothetical protein
MDLKKAFPNLTYLQVEVLYTLNISQADSNSDIRSHGLASQACVPGGGKVILYFPELL